MSGEFAVATGGAVPRRGAGTALVGVASVALSMLASAPALASGQGGLGGGGGTGIFGISGGSGGAGGSNGNGAAGSAGAGISVGGAGGASPGARGADGTADGSGGGGGGGGASGADVSFGTLNNTGTVTGGNGGNGGNGAAAGGAGGGGGGGGDIVVTGTGVMSNSGSLTGGNGGNGGTGDNSGGAGGGDGHGGAGGNGVSFAIGGVTFTNTATGSITGGAGGGGGFIFDGSGIVANADITIINAGSITGGSNGHGLGIVADSGTLKLTNSGTITGFDGIFIHDGTLINSGAIIGTGSSGISSFGGLTAVTNLAGNGVTTGLIKGYLDGIIGDVAITVINSGAIIGTTGNGISGGDVTVTNNAGNGTTTGLIRGSQYGIHAGRALTVINSGAIFGDSGIYATLSGGGSVTVTNNAGNGTTTGIIKGDTDAINVQSGAVTVTNSGAIIASNGAGIYSMDNLTVTNNAGDGVATGLISGTVVGVGTRGNIDLTNAGSIVASLGYGVYNTNWSSYSTVRNTSTGLIQGGYAGIWTYDLNLTNAGSIIGTSIIGGLGYGIYTYSTGSTPVSNVSNVATGLIQGVSIGIFSDVSPLNVTNSGTIIGGQFGISAGGGSSVFNDGTITGGTAAMRFGFSPGNPNTVTLGTGSVINGNVLGAGGDVLQLGGAGSATFDVSQLGGGGQYQGFDSFNKIGSSIWTLTGTPSEATSWNINGGTLSVASDASLGNSNEALSFNGGTLQVTGATFTSTTRAINWGASGGGFDIASAANTFTLTQALTGTGGLTKLGDGMLVLSGANTYSGATSVGAGTLRQGASGAFSAASAYIIATGATLDVGGFDTSLGSLAGTGDLLMGSASLTVGSDNTSTTYSGPISGSGGFTKVGTGRTNLTGISSYTGATVIDAGTLAVNGDITSSSGVTVNAGGTLGGNGFVGNTTINGGALAPGNSIGLLTIVGNLVLTSAATYMVEVSPSGADRVNVTGSANLGGATVSASFAAGSYVKRQYIIINAAGGFGGSSFGALVNSNLPTNFASSLSYDASNAYLNLELAFRVPGGLNANQAQVGNALAGFFNRTGGIPLAFAALSASGLMQASGETATGSQQSTFVAMTQFMSLMTDPFTAGRGFGASGASGYADEALGYASTAKSRAARDAPTMFSKAPFARSYDPRWSVWASGFGGSQTTDGNAVVGSNTVRSSIGGVAVGADVLLSPNTIAGFTLAGGGTGFSLAYGGSGHSDLFQAGAFVRHTQASAYVTAAVAYGWQDIATDRTVTAAGLDRLHAQFSANSFSGRIEGGNRYVTAWFGGVGVTPYIAAQVIALDLPAYAESVAAGASTFALAYAGRTVTATRSELGLRSDKSFAINDAILTLRGRAAWAHDYNTDRSVAATFQALPGASFVVSGASPAHDAALVTAAAEMKWLNGFSLAATFEGELSDVTRSYAGKGVALYAW